jgi:hypothetical protein
MFWSPYYYSASLNPDLYHPFRFKVKVVPGGGQSAALTSLPAVLEKQPTAALNPL